MRKRFFVSLLCFCVIVSIFTVGIPVAQATQSHSRPFPGIYSLTGDGANDIATIALAQKKCTGRELGYTEEWCADFVGDCAILANQSAAVPLNGSVQALKYEILNRAGGKIVSNYSAMRGDLCIIDWDGQGRDYCHIEIVYDVNSTNIETVGGNTGNKSSLYDRYVSTHTISKNSSLITCIIRPNYQNSNPYPEPPYGTILDTSSPQCDDVRWLQWELNHKGYDCGEIDGWYGDKTESAVERFQNEHRLNVTGVFNDGTHAMLVNPSPTPTPTPTPTIPTPTPTPTPTIPTPTPTPTPTIPTPTIPPNHNPYPTPSLTMEFSSGSRGDYVRWIQWQLNNVFGFDCGEIDGDYGNKTINAIKNFQNYCGLAADGIAGYNTLYYLMNGVPVHTPEPTIPPEPTPPPYPTGYYTVITPDDTLNLREDHNANSSTAILEYIPDGALLYVDYFYNGWGRTTYNGNTGWVNLCYCKYNSSINRYYTVYSESIKMRADHSSSADVLDTIFNGAILRVKFFCNGWGKVTYNGQDGWILLSNCRYNYSINRYYTVYSESIELRADHSSSADILTTISNGAILRVKYFYNGWGKVTYNSQDGWILLTNCKYNSSLNRTYTVITPNDTLPLRADHNSNSSTEILELVPDGALLHVDYFYNGWGRTTYNGKTGWVNLCYCKYNSGMNRNYTVLANPLTMYAGNSTSTNVQTTIPHGTVIRVTFFKNGWGKTTYNGKTGWVDLHLCSYNP